VITQLAAANSTASIEQDGTASGTLQSFSIGSDGTITGSFSNGTTATLGQIALASFADEQGLSRNGDNTYSTTLASGQPTIGAPTSGGLGSITAGLSKRRTSTSPPSSRTHRGAAQLRSQRARHHDLRSDRAGHDCPETVGRKGRNRPPGNPSTAASDVDGGGERGQRL